MLDGRTGDQGDAVTQATRAANLDVVVISLATSTERRGKIAEQFKDIKSDWSFFDAHTELRHPELEYDANFVESTFGRPLSEPELAIWSSHYTVVTDFLEKSDSDYLLVFEDDVILDTALPLAPVLDFCADRGLHYLRLFGMYAAPSVQLSYLFNRSIIRYRSSPSGLQAYILSREGARRIARACRRIATSVDLAFDEFWKTGLPIYALFPFPVIERFSPSSNSIGPDSEFTASGRARLLAHRVARKLRKLRANLALTGADARFRRTALGFEQIRQDHMGEP
ncbi:glycosyltransferase family 25 protein [Histidinibacterium aquaticum]|uniref:Glycosyltransferase family 25 protein n=1 Tax=Histidinibacterium aquaticum TaxID=2613962 RepID=A0A5J5GMD6_9RHOB|nr:glycosyltransferase family 25 protein [Histidinibacterium aquaticum]KAA9009419.1 glycosyltransferase family 25 protein [Histidinibacterium aquaticum]